MSGYGNTVLFDDPSLFYIRRHKGQDTWTSTNTPSVQQIINWDKFFYNKVGAWNVFSKVHYIFVCWFTHFLFGKYDSFLSPQDRERYSKEELLKLARKRGINTWGSCINFKRKDEIRSLIRFFIYLLICFYKEKSLVFSFNNADSS